MYGACPSRAPNLPSAEKNNGRLQRIISQKEFLKSRYIGIYENLWNIISNVSLFPAMKPLDK